MPPQPDNPSKVINCETGYARINRSWLLGRLLRDYEMKMEKDPGPEHKAIAARDMWSSLRIDIFDVEDTGKPMIDWVWGLGWLTIVTQFWDSACAVGEVGRTGNFPHHSEWDGIFSCHWRSTTMERREMGWSKT